MSDEQNTNPVQNTADAVKGALDSQVVKQVYEDGIQPALRRTGNAVDAALSLVSIIFTPIERYAFLLEANTEAFKRDVEARIAAIPEDKKRPPQMMIAGPAIEGARYALDEPDLRGMYASLLASSMNADKDTHPSFAGIIGQLSADEAKIVKLLAVASSWPAVTVRANVSRTFEGRGTVNASETTAGGIWASELSDLWGVAAPNIPIKVTFITELENFTLIGEKAACERADMIGSYLDNLIRLGICEVPEGLSISPADAYEEILSHPTVIRAMREASGKGKPVAIRKMLVRTDFGAQFIQACVA